MPIATRGFLMPLAADHNDPALEQVDQQKADRLAQSFFAVFVLSLFLSVTTITAAVAYRWIFPRKYVELLLSGHHFDFRFVLNWLASAAIYSGLTYKRLKGGLRISEWLRRSASYGKSLLAVSAVVGLILLSWLAWGGALEEWLWPIQVHNVNSQSRKQDSTAPPGNHIAAGDSVDEEHQAKPKQFGDAQPEPDLFDEIQSDPAASVEHRTKAPHPQTTSPGEPQNDSTRTNKRRP